MILQTNIHLNQPLLAWEQNFKQKFSAFKGWSPFVTARKRTSSLA